MKRIFLVFVAVLAISCSKETSFSPLHGTWLKGSSHYYITLSEDYQYLDLYNTPWVGTLNINGQPVDIDPLDFIESNTGGTGFRSDDIFISIHGKSVYIVYNDKGYILNDSFTYNRISGQFAITNGVAMENNSENQIKINLSLNAQTRTLLKGMEYKVKADYSYLPFSSLTFMDGGDLKGAMIYQGDILCRMSGDWYLQSDKLHIKYKAEYVCPGGDRAVYPIPEISNDTLKFIKTGEIPYYEYSTLIPERLIQNLKYETVFIKE